MEGTIQLLNPKGYGFIRVEGREKDLFFHATEYLASGDNTFKTLNRGDRVSIEAVGATDRGDVAIGVSLL